MNFSIHNRAGGLPDDGWYDIERKGVHDAGQWPDGSPRFQVLDDEAFNAIVNRFASDRADAGDHWAGMLVDADHLSHDLDKSTEAFAWAKDLRVRDDVLQARLEPTDIGDAAIRNRRFKFFSTEYEPEDLQDLGNGRVRPLRLAGLAFTNRPRKTGGKPILNRDEVPATMPANLTKQGAASLVGEGGGFDPHQPKMKKIAKRLGLPETATEDEILAKLETVLSEAEGLKEEKAGVEADAVMNRFGDRVPANARAHWRQELIKNRAGTEALMNSTFSGARVPIFNRDNARPPAPVETNYGGHGSNRGGVDEAAIRNRAHAIKQERGIPFSQAFEAARGELGV